MTPRSTTTHLIIHHAAGSSVTVEGIHSYHRSKGWAGIAYHYLVRKDGSIYRGRPEIMKGGHTANWNWCSIGVCFEGNFDEEHMSQKQLDAGRGLINDIRLKYPSIEVGRHSEFAQTACPGKNFPFDKLVERCSAETLEGNAEPDDLPDQWAEDSCMWAVENGILKGDNEGYHWHRVITRQEAAVMLFRFLNLLSNKS